MVCRVRYLSSAGIHRREIPGIGALSAAFPQDWLLYASLQCFPRNDTPIEMDAMVVMHDRVLILELKDLDGKLTHNGDLWRNKKRTFRSPVQAVALKARKLKSFLKERIPGFDYYVDSRIVLTGTSTKQELDPAEQPMVWSLQEATSIATLQGRKALLRPVALGLTKAFQQEPEFERVTLNPKMFGPLETEWDGYRVVEPDFVSHPSGIWSEHRAEQATDDRFKALVRVWAFDKLPAGLNSQENRAFIADREMRAIGRLYDLGSPLFRRNAILEPIGDIKREILTQHFELRRLTAGFTTIDRWLESHSDDIDVDDRVTTVASLLEIVAELHAQGIAHRDLGPRSIWAMSPTRISLTGLMACQLPDDESLAEWISILRGHSGRLPEDADRTLAGTAKQRDVYALGQLAFRILAGAPAPEDPGQFSHAFPVPELVPWLARALQANGGARYSDARQLADEFASAVDRMETAGIDQPLIDRHETKDLPYLLWPPVRQLEGDNIYLARDADGAEVVVKTWPSVRRGESTAGDLALTRLFDGVGRLVSSPLPGLPRYVRAGLHAMGPFVAYRYEPGTPLSVSMPKDPEVVLRLSDRLVECVVAIHAMSHSHGDIAFKNILVCEGDTDIRLLDLFDMTPLGDGRVRTPAMSPDNRDALTDEQLDRYATVKVVRALLEGTSDPSLSGEIAILDRELERPRIETFEPIISCVREALDRLQAAKPQRFTITFKGGSKGPFVSDGGAYYLTVERGEASEVEYRLFGIDRMLGIQVRGSEVMGVRYTPANFTMLSAASQFGIAANLVVEVNEGAEAGIDSLLSFLETLAGPPVASEAEVHETLPQSIDVPRYWRKLLELEEAFQPGVEILQDIGPPSGPIAVYAYERLGRDFDFDTGTTVDVLLPTGRRVGEVNLDQTDGQRLVVEFSDRRLAPGDRVNLVERRSRTSFDRRMKAVQRILDDQAAIQGLIDFFKPGSSIRANDYGEAVSDEELKRYRLNKGQRLAFRHVISTGPVAMLQGPPGTGKTLFIASLVHWLTVERGARKILIASQSHEAVNNAIEALLDLFKGLGGRRPSLLRIGSKGITQKIRPYHTSSLQERSRSRFENAFRQRVLGPCSAVGIAKSLATDAIEIDRTIGERARRLKTLTEAERGRSRSPRREFKHRDATLERAAKAFSEAAERILGRAGDPTSIDAELDEAFATILARHPGSSMADVVRTRRLIELSREWAASLASPYRNFEEFLAKTRTVVTATCVGVGQTKIRMERNVYDWVIVDEAARCTPGELAVPIQLGRRVLLVGDHRQLLPMTERAVLRGLRGEMPDTPRQEFERSDFERAFLSSYGRENGHTLTEQYRMAPDICDLVSRIFYEPHGVQLRTSEDREPDQAFQQSLEAPLSFPVTWIDTSHEPDHAELPAPWDPTTFTNPAEIEAIMRLLERIAADAALVKALSSSKSETPIGVICMYSAQKTRIQDTFARRPWDSKFRSLVRVDTVDSYQGKENTIVIVSLVRCNRSGDQGHVRIPNRCNVAMSRAKERLFIVGASRMWGAVPERWPMRRVFDEVKGGAQGCKKIDSRTMR
ncbi:AAA domain-containing protein [Bradyrhizobium sp. CCBAU 53338]|uniref:AAA domain-containing protein n=1 Tax=Bradyrhizobium sp. CCBAU 53338 TaxID=1325111 RepID=UPI00188C4AF5|nr:AAA domain-containing protein [Bradyrhizobium sp. CCBAU 53338]QOZ51572.1 hypothetical protein XH90_09395 [Bradyrhizobium sp. CCBAU 53338]